MLCHSSTQVCCSWSRKDEAALVSPLCVPLPRAQPAFSSLAYRAGPLSSPTIASAFLSTLQPCLVSFQAPAPAPDCPPRPRPQPLSHTRACAPPSTPASGTLRVQREPPCKRTRERGSEREIKWNINRRYDHKANVACIRASTCHALKQINRQDRTPYTLYPTPFEQ
jgi:hypothetical protein